MPTLQVRLSDEVHAAVKEKGGSPWVRSLIERELSNEVSEGATLTPDAELDEAEEILDAIAAATPGILYEPATDNGAGERTHAVLPVMKVCPRWMHHRKGVFCKTCNQSG